MDKISPVKNKCDIVIANNLFVKKLGKNCNFSRKHKMINSNKDCVVKMLCRCMDDKLRMVELWTRPE